MSAPPDTSQLLAALDEENLQATALLRVLEREHTALRSLDPQALDSAVQDKQTAVDRLQALATHRLDLLKRAGCAASPEQLPAWLAARGGDLARRGRALFDTLAGCQRQNLSNGVLLEASRRQVHQALAILFGQDGSVSTYNRNGATAAGGGASRPIAKA